jgi:hypothetical protein
VPLTAALLLLWYGLVENWRVERRRIRIAVLILAATLGIISGGAFVISTVYAFASGSNLGPIAGLIMAVVVAPSALFLGAVIGFIYSRFVHEGGASE